MQPLDKTVYDPLKKNLTASATSGWPENYRLNVAEIFGKAYIEVAQMLKAINGVLSTALWTFNPDIFPNEVYLSSLVTDEPEQALNVTEPSTTMRISEPPLEIRESRRM